ncbi:basic proline-rich protein-like [Ovis canadensis]|uniref:basic proline-rich protein-like n=1 Tax=Ovis canadensis TaxID=37174 RepID=UPI0037508BCA
MVHGDYHRKLIGQTFEWVVAATGVIGPRLPGVTGPPAPAPGRGREEADRVGFDLINARIPPAKGVSARRHVLALELPQLSNREEGGVGNGARRAGPDRPGPARGEDARPRDAPGPRSRAPPPPRGRHEGEGRMVRREEEGGGPPSFPSSAPPGPGHHTGDGRRASASACPPTPERGGEAGRRGHGDRPAGGKTGTVPARASASGGAPSSSTRRRRRRRRRRHGRRIGAAAGGKRAIPGHTAPGSSRRRGDRGGRTDGEGHRRDAAARGRHHATGGGGGVAARHREGNGPKRPGGGDASRPPGPTAGSHRQRPPGRGGPAAPPGTTTDWRPHPSRGSRPPPPPPPEPQPARGEHFPPHRRPPPPTALARAGLPAPPPAQGLPRALLRPGTPPARQRPGDDTHVRRDEAGSGPDRGRERGRSHARDEGEDEAGGGGEADDKAGRAAGPPGTPARDPTATRTRGRSRDAWGAGRPRPSLSVAHDRPRRHGRRAVHRLPPSIRDGSVFPSESEPRGATSRDDALERGGPDRDRTPPPAAAQGARAGATGPSSPPAGGAGEAEADRASRPDTAPFPRAHTTGAGRTHTAPHLPDARRGPAGPSPDAEGEARAAVGNERHGPTAGPAHPTPSPPTEGGGVLLCPCSGSRHGGHCALGRGSGWGLRYPKAPSRIAREGVLTEGAPSLPWTVSPSGPRRRSASHQASAGREGLRCREADRHTSGARSGPEQSPRVPPPARPHPPRPPRRGEQARFPTARPPQKRSHWTPTPPWRGPEGDTGLRETTPPLGLRHPRDDLERSRGTAEGHTRHARTPAWGAQRGGGGTALPATGRAARGHTPRRQEQSAVSEDQRRPLTPRGKGQQETEDQGQRPHTQPLPSSPALMGSGGEDKRGAPRTDREERTRSLGTPVPRLARLRLGPGEHDHTTSIRGAKVGRGGTARTVTRGARFKPRRQPPSPHLASGERPTTPRGEHLTRSPQGGGRPSRPQVPTAGARAPRVEDRHAPPPSGRPETGGGTVGRVSRRHHTGAGAQAQAGGSSGKGRTGHQLAAQKPRAPRASRDPQSSVANTKGDRVSTYLVAKKAY